jgi:hypothetical protein
MEGQGSCSSCVVWSGFHVYSGVWGLKSALPVSEFVFETVSEIPSVKVEVQVKKAELAMEEGCVGAEEPAGDLVSAEMSTMDPPVLSPDPALGSAIVPRRMGEWPGVHLVQLNGASVASAPSALMGEEPPDAKDPILEGTDRVCAQPKDYDPWPVEEVQQPPLGEALSGELVVKVWTQPVMVVDPVLCPSMNPLGPEIVEVVSADLALPTNVLGAVLAVVKAYDDTSVYRGCQGFESHTTQTQTMQE